MTNEWIVAGVLKILTSLSVLLWLESKNIFFLLKVAFLQPFSMMTWNEPNLTRFKCCGALLFSATDLFPWKVVIGASLLLIRESLGEPRQQPETFQKSLRYDVTWLTPFPALCFPAA